MSALDPPQPLGIRGYCYKISPRCLITKPHAFCVINSLSLSTMRIDAWSYIGSILVGIVVIIYNSKCETCIFIQLHMHVLVNGLIVAYYSYYCSDKGVINDIGSTCLLGKISPICNGVYTEKVWFIRSCGDREKR